MGETRESMKADSVCISSLYFLLQTHAPLLVIWDLQDICYL